MESITEKQISGQIEGKTTVKVIFLDSTSEFLSLYTQTQGDEDFYFISPAFLKSKKINKDIYEELYSQFTEEQKFNTDPEIIRTELSYNDFYNKYYNSY